MLKGNVLSALKVFLMIIIYAGGCSSGNTEEYIKDLKSENVMVQNEAIYYLGTLEEKSAVPILCEFLNLHKPKEVKLKAIEALGTIGEKSAVGSLIGILGEKDSELRIAAIEALGKIEDPKAIPALVNVLEDNGVQLFAIWALGNIGDKSAAPALTNLLGDPDKYVRYNAAQSLKEIGNGK
ncbi:MAG: HEAT repeat domain-containing protein [Pseudomonadota bacterium]